MIRWSISMFLQAIVALLVAACETAGGRVFF